MREYCEQAKPQADALAAELLLDLDIALCHVLVEKHEERKPDNEQHNRDNVTREAVVHCHAPYCTAFAQANMAYDDPASPEFQILFGKVPCLKYGTPGSPDIIAELPKYIQDYDVVFLQNHGVLAVGSTPLEAYSRIMSVEMLLQVYYIRKTLFPNAQCDLPAEELEVLAKMHQDKRG